ncbi:MAG: NAD-dependent epimerase/dehydratase family protein [Elusimicrobia bacterium]|nr:NAD-dependent epimerase/dehydratase family protein [Elusimicrobiota bacterium]
MRILVTFGGTREYIDAVRFIANLSTGATGSAIAGYLSRRKHEVVCLRSEGALRPQTKRVKTIEFSGFKDLDSKMRALLKGRTFDAVIHLAAVSDYSPVSVKLGAQKARPGRAVKINSDAGRMTIVLKRNFKILDRIKDYALRNRKPYKPLVIGFKLTASASKAKALACVRALGSADFVVHNDLREREAENAHIFHIYKDGLRFYDCRGALALAEKLDRIITKGLRG